MEKVVDTRRSFKGASEEAADLLRVLDIARGIIRKNPELGVSEGIAQLLEANNVPSWGRSVRVEHVGIRKFNVIVSSDSNEEKKDD